MSRGAGSRPRFLDEIEGDAEGKQDPSAVFAEFGDVRKPDESEAPILGPVIRQVLHQWLYELNFATELSAVNVKPRRRAILDGPPGTGKTTLAHHIAARLALPLVVVETPAIVSKYIGHTGENIGKLFRLARRRQVALFFDEFDVIAARREDNGSSAGHEKNAIVGALLQMFDRHEGLIFAATNRGGTIDPAIWRRFQLHLQVELPGAEERFAIVKRYLAPFDAHEATIEALAEGLEQAAPALIKDVVEAVKRDLILAPRLQHKPGARNTLARVLSSIAPAEDMPTPPFWHPDRGDDAVAALEAAPWPPTRSVQ